MIPKGETLIVNKIKRYLKSLGSDCFYWKEHGGAYGTAGIPDLILCYKGFFVGLEVKTQTGKPTRLQEITIHQIRKASGYAFVVRSVDETKRIIAIIDEELQGGSDG